MNTTSLLLTLYTVALAASLLVPSSAAAVASLDLDSILYANNATAPWQTPAESARTESDAAEHFPQESVVETEVATTLLAKRLVLLDESIWVWITSSSAKVSAWLNLSIWVWINSASTKASTWLSSKKGYSIAESLAFASPPAAMGCIVVAALGLTMIAV